MRSTEDQKLALLRQVPLFAGLNSHQIERVGALCDEVDVEAGRVLTREGERGQEFFIIVDGQVQVERNGQLLRTLGPGDFFGEIALIEEGPRTATLTTIGPTRLLVLNRREFHSLLSEFAEIQIKVLQALARRVRELAPEALH